MANPAPRIEFPTELPVSRMRDEIAAQIRDHQVIIVAGETGSGKTTQLPKIALTLGRERIAHTQPRRIAARTIAERIAEETGTKLGDLVGYQVRFSDKVSEHTKIRLMTDGILLNAIHRDRDLTAYDTIIIDEAHERSLNIDFLLGYLKRLLPRRPDLKVIITSATIDPESFAHHFRTGDVPAPIIEVSGRTFPVELRYRPLTTTDPARDTEVERDLFDAIGDAVAELEREQPGDVLVFLSGEAEIRDATDALRGRTSRPGGKASYEVLPLYGRLSVAEQHRVFSKGAPGTRRIVLATNVAETSLTVPGIRYVIDAGTARISRYSTRSKVQRLPIEAISQASANQRSGRSGRTSPGIAIRLYSEEDFESRPEFTDPEILRTGLASVILQMLALGLGEISRFPFLTPPDSRGIRDGLGLLAELGAVRTEGKRTTITKIGRELSRLPIEPRFARMVIEARRRDALPEVIAIVAGLTIQDVRERPQAERGRADELHRRFRDPQGDLMTLLNLWNYLQEQQQELSSSAFRRLCKAEFLNFLRVREWMDLNRQLLRAAKVRSRDARSDSEAIHRSILSGLLSQLGVRDDTRSGSAAKGAAGRRSPGGKRAVREYVGSRGTRFVLFPGSVLAKQPPEVVMTVELVETSRLFARQNAVVDPAWAEELAGPLAKRNISEPHWEKNQGAAVAYERVTLFGVPIVERRRVQFSRFDLAHARELFIRHALVEGEWDSPQAFDRANRQLRRELGQLEERARRRGLVGDDDAVYEFYDARIPSHVASVRDFEGWWKTEQRTRPKLLNLTREDLLDDEDPGIDEAEFPRQWRMGDQSLRLRYRFDPAAADDGVTVNVPLPLLPRLDSAEFEKLVPGLRQELVAGLIRTLPKPIRKHVVPAADWAKSLLAAIKPGLDSDTPLTELLAAEIQRRTSQIVSASDFDPSRLPTHLTPTFRIVDERGRTVGSGKDLARLREQHRGRVTKDVAKVAAAAPRRSDLEVTGATTWQFGELPRYLDTPFAQGRGGAGVVRAYPALVDRRTSVDLALVADAAEQDRLSRLGVRRLVVLSSPSPASYVREHLSNQEKLLLSAGPYPTLDSAIADVSLAVADQSVSRHAPDGLVWDAETFQRIADDYAGKLIDDIFAAVGLTARVLEAARLARKAIDETKSLQVLGQVTDAANQVGSLVFDRFVSRTGLPQLERLPVYLDAVVRRMRGLSEQPGRDRTRQNEIDRALTLFSEAGGTIPLAPHSPEKIVRARWLIEELRVSLFAQELRTAEPASLTRLQKLLA